MSTVFKLSRIKEDVFVINADEHFPNDEYECEITTYCPSEEENVDYHHRVDFRAVKKNLNYMGDPGAGSGTKVILISFFLNHSDSCGFIVRRYHITTKFIYDGRQETIRPYFIDNYEFAACKGIIQNIIALFKKEGYYIDDSDFNPLFV